MRALCPNRGCSALHDLDSHELGETFVCARCGALLGVEAGGLRLYAARAPWPDDPEPTEEPPPMPPPPLTHADRSSSTTILLFSLLFGLGAVLVILFLFLPVIDQTALMRHRARVKEGEAKLRQKERELLGEHYVAPPRRFEDRFKDKIDGKPPEPPSDQVIKEVQEARKVWKKQRDKLEEEEDLMDIANGRAMYPYTWGMLFGFLFLAVSSVGFLSLGPGRAYRVVGAVVLIVQVLLIFVVYLFGSFGLRWSALFR